MDNLLTRDPIALQALMSETIFTTGFDVGGNDDKDAKMSIPTGTSGTHAVEKEEFIYRGDKDTGVLFILRYPDHPYFSPEAEDAFIKTIGALQLTLQDVAVVNLANEHNPNDSLKLPAIAHNSYMRGKIATVFNTFSFEEMFVDIDKKKLFWTEFKSFLQS
jgi:hypothetical protein